MDQSERDNDQLGIIIRYCDRLNVSRSHFGSTFEVFSASEPFQDSCSLCLIQIGEAVIGCQTNSKKIILRLNGLKSMECDAVSCMDMTCLMQKLPGMPWKTTYLLFASSVKRDLWSKPLEIGSKHEHFCGETYRCVISMKRPTFRSLLRIARKRSKDHVAQLGL